MQYIKHILILFVSTAIMQAQEKSTKIFSQKGAIEAKIAFSTKQLKKSYEDTVYFDTPLRYKFDGQWNEMTIGIRARGNFRRSTCYYPPVKVDLKKGERKNTIFSGQKKMKLVLPCLQQKDKNDNILKELMVYKLYELVTPYHFKTRRLRLTFKDLSKRNPEEEVLNAFFIEDDKKVAKRHEAKVMERFVHPLAMQPDVAVRNALFQYMIGNTDFSVAYQHNGKLLYVNNKALPLPYDFDMSGFINPSYAVVNETLNIRNIRERKFRGFKRKEDVFYAARDHFISQKSAMFSLMRSFENDFQNPKEYQEAYTYLEGFFEIIEDDAAFRKNIIDAARTK